MADTLRGIDWDPTVSNKMPLCFLKPRMAEMGLYTTTHIFLNILGSMTQYQGRSHGLIYDPETLAPLVRMSAYPNKLASAALLRCTCQKQTAPLRRITDQCMARLRLTGKHASHVQGAADLSHAGQIGPRHARHAG